MAEKLKADILNAQGTPMLTAKKIRVRDGKIVMDGNILRNMPGQFYITPLNLYIMWKMIDFSVVSSAVKMLFKGRKEYKALQKESEAEKSEADK